MPGLASGMDAGVIDAGSASLTVWFTKRSSGRNRYHAIPATTIAAEPRRMVCCRVRFKRGFRIIEVVVDSCTIGLLRFGFAVPAAVPLQTVNMRLRKRFAEKDCGGIAIPPHPHRSDSPNRDRACP